MLGPEACTHVLGNPPFVGAKYQSEAQRRQVRALAALPGSGGTLDYVAAWFVKAARYAAGGARIGFVATNSIVQGEQVAQLWPILFREGLEIAFAHRSFVWPGRAAVHCVILGLAPRGAAPAEKRLFSYADPRRDPVETRHAALTAYLFEAGEADPHLVVREAPRPINGAPRVVIGSKPIDGGYLIFTAAERAAIPAGDAALDYLRPYLGGEEYLNGGMRWILVLGDAPPDLRRSPVLRERLRRVADFRRGLIPAKGRTEAKTPGLSALALAPTPAAFHVTVIPDAPYLVIPEVSSERRDYVPIGWIEPPVVPSNKLRLLPGATLWHFGVLTSRMHMAWTRIVGGRLKSDYQYGIGLNYNTFPWPDAAEARMTEIERLARAVLDARALPRNATSTLADLYDPDTMAAALHRAHRALDLAVDRLYRARPFGSDGERVAHLFGLYQRLVAPLTPPPARRGSRRRGGPASAR